MKRIAIGTNKLSSPQQPDGMFPSVIATAIQNNIDTFESTLHKEEAMRRGITDAVMFLNSRTEVPSLDIAPRSLKVLGRVGYRTSSSQEKMEGDILQDQTMDGNSDGGSGAGTGTGTGTEIVYHNLSNQHITDTISKSPLVELHRDMSEVDTIYCLHNPETQGMELLQKDAPLEDVRGFIHERMVEAFVTMERMVAEEHIGSYGVCSNGLSLQSSHPMHLSWEHVMGAALDAVKEVHGNASGTNQVAKLSTLQLPINLLETHGLKVANRIKQYLASPEKSDGLPKKIQIHSTRPLTCYPDRGTGTGYPFKLVDYLIPTAEDGSGQGWSHEMKSMPTFYTQILNETMAHFDASHIIELKEIEGRELSVEERETLDGCKLLQSMIHDLDNNLSSGQIRSFLAYEEDLYTKVVPLIHDTFEELDEDSANLLQRFFRAHGTAVRHSIAKTTRSLLKSGGQGVEKYDIPDNIKLQEFALQFLLQQTCDGEHLSGNEPLIDRIVVGCSRAEHVIEAVQSTDNVND